MQEVFTDNKLDLKVYVNGIPKLENLPKEEYNNLSTLFRRSLSDYYAKTSSENNLAP